ncbi:MAG: sodium:proton exchanger [Candidatus Magasanikbacteria bacterium]|nr:sodium:proton exchanger [Candidatus Magasanikbacteria bacterium]MBT4541887.1 sodium:proton exchanger [Candidatus Magasanikbacteria bacterium]MBT6252856.1 sodium:proton exchanger [Candidatus Magasanikbacteria bacterium]MBT7754742.1 sodium:proton exchanger [Candidatus Magasanikbacteria bacterium]
MVDNIFLQISVLLGLTVSIAFVIRLLRQPLMIAYIIAGIIAGPLFLNVISSGHGSFDAFAELGVVLLLFVVGLSLNFSYIKKVGRVAMIAGVGQVLFTATFGWLILNALGFNGIHSLYLAIAMTFSSTIIIIKLLSDKKDLETVYGRYTIGLLLVQDLIAIFIMIMIKTTGLGDSLVTSISSLFIKGVIVASIVYFLAKVVLPPLLNRVAKSAEFLFLFTVAWCFGIASLVHWFGFGLEIGAVIAGISLGSSPYSLEISSRIKPLRDFFIVIFFIILGSQLGVANIPDIIVPGLILSAFILIGNPLILYILFRLTKFTRRNSLLIGSTAAQVSEFGFILLFTGQQAGIVSTNDITIFTMVALITIFISSYTISYNEKLYKVLKPILSIFGKDSRQQKEDKEKTYDVIVIGYHRIGWKICETLVNSKKTFAVVDYNPEVIKSLKGRGIHAYFGDVADVEFLNELPLKKAKLIISTIPEADDQITLIRHIRKENKQKPYIIGNLFHSAQVEDLYAAGADYVMMPHLLGGHWIADIVTKKPWTKRTFGTLKREQKKEMTLRFSTQQNK